MGRDQIIESDKSDQELIASAISGDGDSFDVLMRRYYQTIRAFSYRISGNVDADDITQEALIKIAKSIRSYRGDSKFSSWCYTIVVNVARDFARSRARKQRIEDRAEGEIIHAEHSYADSRRSKEVREALVSLNESERVCVVLSIFEGLSHREIGDILGCAETTVSWRIFKAKKTLKKLLTEDEIV